MGNVTGLIPLALYRIGDLRDSEAKEAALGVLSRALNEIPAPLGEDGEDEEGPAGAPEPPHIIAAAFERILEMSRAFEGRGCRARAFGTACESIAVSLLPLRSRRALLDHALDLGLGASDVTERIAAATTAIDARLDVRWGERTDEVLADLERAAASILDEEARAGAVLQIAGSLAKSGETDRALVAIEALPPSGGRALGLANVAFALDREGLVAEAAEMISRVLIEVQQAEPSPERALALRAVLAHAVTTGIDLGYHSALTLALDVADMIDEVAAQKAALVGAILALPETAFEGEALSAALDRVAASLGRVDDLDMRVGLLGRFAASLAALGELDASVSALHTIAGMVAWLRASGASGPSVSLPIALPVLEILGLLAGVDFEPQAMESFAFAAIDLLAHLEDDRGVAGLLAEMTHFFASPALPYASRVALLDRTLGAAQRIELSEARVEVVAHVADALSIAGATERGDALFAGLVSGVGARGARSVRLARAVTLVRLGRTADARAEIAAAAAATGGSAHEIEELACTMARCGFLSDMIGELMRVDGARQGEARAQLADVLVEATYLDPYLREIGLSTLLSGTTGPVRETIACLLEQVRVLEGLGDADEILARAFGHNATIEDRRSAGIFDRQLVDALIERIRSTPQETATAT
jgi:hypothetical protein